MDVAYFFNRRLAFIRQFYLMTSGSYIERKRKIEAEEEPFLPSYIDDGEPAFLDEWLEADTSLHVLAFSCVSMLAAALHLYLETWVIESRVPVDESLKKSFKDVGWFQGYQAHYSQHFQISFEMCPEDLALLKEIVLARNRIEHPLSIVNLRSQYSCADIKKLPSPFFVDEKEQAFFAGIENSEKSWFISPTLYITEKHLFAAIAVAEGFSRWFELEIRRQVYPQ